jgi:hypothetical protein
MENILPILTADAPDALLELCGVNLLERLLRILQRLGFRRAVVFSTTPEIVGAEVAKRSWAREQIIVDVVPGVTGAVTPQLIFEQSPSERFLIVQANIYCDPRLLAALCAKDSPAALIDSNPPEFARSLIRNSCGPALVTKNFLSVLSPTAPLLEQLKASIDKGTIDIVDAAQQDDYIVSMRRHVRQRRGVGLRASFWIPRKMEHSTCQPTFTDQSKRQSSRFFAKRESHQTKLRLEVSSSVAARPRRSHLAVSGSELLLRSYLVSSMDWMESSRA